MAIKLHLLASTITSAINIGKFVNTTHSTIIKKLLLEILFLSMFLKAAGHQDAIQLLPSGWLLKPCTKYELNFYLSLPVALKPFVPPFICSLPVNDPQRQGGCKSEDERRQLVGCIVIENVMQNYKRPCVLDAKIGRIYYGPDATKEKQQRMDKKARSSTSWNLGVRICGMQVFLLARTIINGWR